MGNNRETIEAWMSAFNDEGFQEELQGYRNSIEILIKDYIQSIKQDKDIMMFDSIESRIKSRDSFEQKLSRNDYVNTWSLDKDIEKNQEYIKKNLSDVIGFRISCYFKDDENRLYNKLLDDGIEGVVLDRKTNTKQENGHEIYKIEGLFKEECRFEIQIKSLVHNIWGEVEHKTIYKTRAFDCNIEDRKAITEGTYNILTATDTQLNALFKMNYDVDKMIKGLFYEMTKKEMIKEFKTDILGKAYNQFFSIFYNKYSQQIRVYVANMLLGKHVDKIKVINKNNEDEIEIFEKKLSDKYLNYDFDLVKAISENILIYDNPASFYGLILSILSPNIENKPYGDEENFSEEDDEFENEADSIDPHKELDDRISIVFERLNEFRFKEVKRA